MSGGKKQKWEELLSFDNCIQPKFDEIFKNPHPLKSQWQKKIFKNLHPITLEVGCGRGEYTIELAKQYPKTNFIGIDIKGSRIWKGAKEAFEKNLKNVYFIRANIDCITSFFDTKEIDNIWITFPDPQPKKGDINKRLTSPKFLKKYQQIIKPEGLLFFKTDNFNLFEYTKQIIQKEHKLIKIISDIHGRGEKKLTLEESNILKLKTYYENLFEQQGHKSYFIKFRL